MSETRLLDLVHRGGLVTTARLAQATALPLAEVCLLLEQLAAASGPDALQLLYLLSTEGEGGIGIGVGGGGRGGIGSLHRGREKAERAWAAAAAEGAALRLVAVRAHREGGRPALLRPSAAVTHRPYPTTTRARLEAGQPPPPPIAAKGEPTPMHTEHTQPTPMAMKLESAPQSPPTGMETEPTVPMLMKPEPPAPLPVEAKAEPEKQDEPAAEHIPSAAAARGGRQQCSLLDMMMKNSNKRTKDAEEDGKMAGKNSKKTKTEKSAQPPPTKSIAKLARASAKAKTSTVQHDKPVVQPLVSVLDDEEQHDEGSCFEETSLENNNMYNEAELLNEETPCMNVVISTVNDDIIVCDDAAPLAFLAPQRMSPQETSPDLGAKGAGSPSLTTTNASQSTLSLFFNAEVVKFQKNYVRELRTDTKLVNDEYICVDVPCYRSIVDNTIITEEEFHQRSMKLMAKTPPQEEHNRKIEEEGASVAHSPSAARVASKPVVRPSVSKQAIKENAPTSRNLLSFFKAKQ